MKKRWTALVLTLSMVCALALPAHAAEKVYPDTTGHYAADAISAWSEYGVLEGYLDGSFRPDGKITRAEMATVLNRVMGYQNKAENTFTDLPQGQWYTDYLLRAAAEGVFKGNPDGTMKPNEPITRQEAFAALSRVLNMAESEKATGFKDDASIADWARGYVSAMKQAGYIQGDQKGNIRAGDPITRAEVVTILNKMARGFVNADGTYSKDCKGNLIVNAQDVTLKDMTVEGDLIVADGVGDGDVYLDKVTVKGDIVLRGCGENSFHILPGTKVEKIIVTKTSGGMLRLTNESGKTIPMIFVNDGKAGVTIDGDKIGEIVVTCDTKVSVAAKNVKTLSVVGNAKVTVEKGSTISKLDVAKTAKAATLTVSGKVTSLTNDAKIKVENKGGTVGSGSSGSGSGSSGSGGGSSGNTTLLTTIDKVTIQLVPPSFAGTLKKAVGLGIGYVAESTEWSNADGTTPTKYRWKESEAGEDSFTADHAYRATITLSPISGYKFVADLKATVTNNEINYEVKSVAADGDNRIVIVDYAPTEAMPYISNVTVSGAKDTVIGEAVTLSMSYRDNRIVAPNHKYQWYTCTDANGNGEQAIPGAISDEYVVTAQSLGKFYYRYKVTVEGEIFASPVVTIVVEDPYLGEIPPVIIDEDYEIRYDADGTTKLLFTVHNIVSHSSIKYYQSASIGYRVEKQDGEIVEKVYTEIQGGGLYEKISEDTYKYVVPIDMSRHYIEREKWWNYELAIPDDEIIDLVAEELKIDIYPVVWSGDTGTGVVNAGANREMDLEKIVGRCHLIGKNAALEGALKQAKPKEEIIVEIAPSYYDGYHWVSPDVPQKVTGMPKNSWKTSGTPYYIGLDTVMICRAEEDGELKHISAPTFSVNYIGSPGQEGDEWEVFHMISEAEISDETTTMQIEGALFYVPELTINSETGREIQEVYIFEVEPKVVFIPSST